nr:hypothetical protein Iba_chr08aCG10800 [Ipomoea batatas]
MDGRSISVSLYFSETKLGYLLLSGCLHWIRPSRNDPHEVTGALANGIEAVCMRFHIHPPVKDHLSEGDEPVILLTT